MNLGGGGNMFAAHADLLEAPLPVHDAASLGRLVEECKSRAKAAVGAGQWPMALKLYEKALEASSSSGTSSTASSTTNPDAAILHANRSLCHGKMNAWPQALAAAQAGTAADAAYVKGWWRLAQAEGALARAAQGVASLDQALALEPTNKALQKERTKLQAQAVQEASTPVTPSPATTTTTTAKTTTTTAVPKTTTTTSKASETVVDMDTEHADFKPSEPVRGYKVVNGKKTSYFHHELSQDAAQLIGDIAPKKLQDNAATNNANAPKKEEGRSAWNKAGTWEEKDVTAWAHDSLKSQLAAAAYPLPASSPAPGATVVVGADIKVEGHASVATVRGKKRYIYEFSVTVPWTFVHNTTTTANGQLIFPDVDGTCVVGEPYEAGPLVVTDASDDTLRPVLDTFVYRGGLRDAVHKALDDWVGLFQATF